MLRYAFLTICGNIVKILYFEFCKRISATFFLKLYSGGGAHLSATFGLVHSSHVVLVLLITGMRDCISLIKIRTYKLWIFNIYAKAHQSFWIFIAVQWHDMVSYYRYCIWKKTNVLNIAGWPSARTVFYPLHLHRCQTCIKWIVASKIWWLFSVSSQT
jgi:hypothetical protein